jgi:3-mercaptopyruvate sulfurtransferase SseA
MNKTNSKKTLLELVAGAILIAVLLTACAPASPPVEVESASPVAETSGEVQRVTLEESKAAFDSGEAVFLDVRSASSYAASHIPDALSIPLAELEVRINEIDPNQWIITYCT